MLEQASPFRSRNLRRWGSGVNKMPGERASVEESSLLPAVSSAGGLCFYYVQRDCATTGPRHFVSEQQGGVFRIADSASSLVF